MPPSVILISIDSLRYDCVSYQARHAHLEAVGIDALPETPNLDRLIAGHQFTQAVATAPYTTSSHASVFTARVPPDHGIRSFMKAGLAEDVSPLPDWLAPLGYRSLLMSDTPWLFRSVGLERGFEAVTEDLETARQWWHQRADQPRLLFIHTMHLHEPYGFRKPGSTPSRDRLAENRAWLERVRQVVGLGDRHAAGPSSPDDSERTLMRRLRRLHHEVVTGREGLRRGLLWYLAALQHVDCTTLRTLVDWFDEENVFDSAVIVVFGDHGEGFDPTWDVQLSHGCLMYDDVIRVPLSIRVPGERGREIATQCSLVDVAPTLAEIIGAPEPQLAAPGSLLATLNGRSLAPLFGGSPVAPRPAYAELWQRAARRGRGDRADTLRQRIVRWPDRKISFIGRRIEYGPALAETAGRDLVLRLCHDLLGHAEMDDRRLRRLARLADWTGPLGRRLMFWLFQQRANRGPIPRAAVFDLAHDPLERRPLRVDPTPADHPHGLEVLDWFETLDQQARPGTPLAITRREMSTVEQRLFELGYVD